MGWAGVWLGMALAGAVPVRASVYVTGQVVVERTQAPVGGATVSLYTGDHPLPVDVSQSLHNGSFVLQAPSAGQYRLETSSGTCFTTTQTIIVTKRGVSALHVSVRDRPTLLLQVVSQSLVPIQHHSMQVLIQTTAKAGNSRGYVPARSSQQGVVHVIAPEYFPEARDVQSLALLVRVPGEGIGEVHLPQWPGKLVVIRVVRPGVVSGVVLDKAGKPMVGVGVIATRLITPDALVLGRGRLDVATDTTGQFAMPFLAPARYRVEVANLDQKLYPPVEVDLGSNAIQIKFAPAHP